jgi:16S rRNA (guanine527-N7)-methyltransferase
MSNNIQQEVTQLFLDYEIELSLDEQAQFSHFLELFIAYNSHTNLSAIREPRAIIQKHFIDSLIPFLQCGFSSGTVLDIWSGGGFPGIPLAIIFPHLQITCLDSVSKKTKAIDSFVAELHLPNVSTVWSRAETYAKQEHTFDYIVSRATAYLPEILTWSLPFMKRNSKIILYKTPSIEELRDGNKFLKRHPLKETSAEYSIDGSIRKYYVYSK